MVGIELAVGFLFAWAVRKAKRVAGRMDTEVDLTLDAGMDRLHRVVAARLGTDPALERMIEEAGSGTPEPTDRTRQRLQLALEEAVENDTGFAEALREAVAEVRSAESAAGAGPTGNTASGNTFHGPAAISMGDHSRQENHFGAS
ncbi:chromosome partitioning protein [Streptomyces sp. CBMA156]|uniref:chromosome partitioning protein n=1 Tax=Streptomyces sp. CBMA156 TaxID=1930280 RepID=UPI001661B0E9|nr:chromosome partitioning protein [Streptomyces sp. CBMA156]MBD0670211.1 chromosome partitioning protein [Streptomyces sp. CBMA156]